jgi:DNA replication ATP-dependent helicase Dna2
MTVLTHLIPLQGYGVSLLKRLADAHPDAVVPLTFQYRMNDDICQLSNDLVYHGNLKCGNEVVRKQKLCLPLFPRGLHKYQQSFPWLKRIIDPIFPVVFVNTDTMGAPSVSPETRDSFFYLESSGSKTAGGNVMNATEANLTTLIASSLVACGLNPSDIGVITPFRAQVRRYAS